MNRATRFLSLIFFGLLAISSLEARTVRIATFNLRYGPQPPSTTGYEAVKAVLRRIDADIVAFQEIFNDGQTNRIPGWRQMASELGYDYKIVAEVNGGRAGFIYLGYFSRFPILETFSVSSPAPASEMTRLPLRAKFLVPEAAKPLVVWNMHHKAARGDADRFRRAVEAYRLVQDINAYTAANPDHNEFVFLGDLNEDIDDAAVQPESFDYADYLSYSRSTTWPFGYVLGADLAALLQGESLPYRAFPDDRYSPAGGGLHRLDLRQQDGATSATIGARRLDYILVSTALRDSSLGAPHGEVYNSQLDTAIYPGLRKPGDPLPADTSANASDHLAVFADIEMEDAEPATFVTSFSPAAGAPGAEVTITGLLLGAVDSVRFGGAGASFFAVDEGGTQIIATVPAGAATGPITVSGPDGEASSVNDFLVAVSPTAELALATPSSLEGFSAMTGTPSAAQSFTVSAAGLRGPLAIVAPAGFEVSADGLHYAALLELGGWERADNSSNYGVLWESGMNGGTGFHPWSLLLEPRSGSAAAYIGNPADSGVTGMGSRAFALRADPGGSGAWVAAERRLRNPLGVGESLQFDWGINWDSNSPGGHKEFLLVSGDTPLLYVVQYNFPGRIYLNDGQGWVDTDILYGTGPMTWTFTQLDPNTLRVTATGRGDARVAFTRDLEVPGAVNGFSWRMLQNDQDIRRRSYYDNLQILPPTIGGGALETTIYVRLAAGAPADLVSGDLQLASGGKGLGGLTLSGTVTTAGAAYEAWADSHDLNPAGDGAPWEDPDRDGHDNLREFWFGGHPLNAEAALLVIKKAGRDAVLSFVGRESARYRVLGKPNLVSGAWTARDLTIGEVVPDGSPPPAGYRRLQAVIPEAVGAGFFQVEAAATE